jgi:hypothetical protein
MYNFSNAVDVSVVRDLVDLEVYYYTVTVDPSHATEKEGVEVKVLSSTNKN